MPRKASIDVWRLKGFDRRNGTVHGRALWEQVFRLTAPEANLLVHHKYAAWRGRKPGKAVTLLIPMGALMVFVGQMRMKERPEVRGLDSKTHASHGPNPWKQCRHVRNESYTAAADALLCTYHAPDEETGRDQWEVLFRSLLAGLRRNQQRLEATPRAERFHQFPIRRPDEAAA